MIKYSDIQYMIAVKALGDNINAICTTPTGADGGATNVDAMRKFIELYQELGAMMNEYHKFLQFDQQTLLKVGMTMKLQDMEVTKLWK